MLRATTYSKTHKMLMCQCGRGSKRLARAEAVFLFCGLKSHEAKPGRGNRSDDPKHMDFNFFFWDASELAESVPCLWESGQAFDKTWICGPLGDPTPAMQASYQLQQLVIQQTNILAERARPDRR